MFQFDVSDPEIFIFYSGDDHAEPEDYRALGDHWIQYLERGQRFGIILVSDDHDHDHETEEETAEHRAKESEITRLINDFRRDYRDKTSAMMVGFVRVIPEIWMDKYNLRDPEVWQESLAGNDRYAQYNWGIPGHATLTLDEAKAWIRERLNTTTQGESQPETSVVTEIPVSKKVGLFYGSSTGMTEYVAFEIQEVWAKSGQEPIEAINIGNLKNLSALTEYDYLILGIPTWNIGELQDDWDIMFAQLDTLDFTGKKAAIFGVGDQYGYPDNFLDAIGILGKKLVERGIELVGYWNDEQYEFTESVGFVDGKFMGLGIDETNQSKLTSERIAGWIPQIIGEFALETTNV